MSGMRLTFILVFHELQGQTWFADMQTAYKSVSHLHITAVGKAVAQGDQPVTAVSDTWLDAISHLEAHEAAHQCLAHQMRAASHVLQ